VRRSNKQNASAALAKRLTRTAKLEDLEAKRKRQVDEARQAAAAEDEEPRSYAGKFFTMENIIAVLPLQTDLPGAQFLCRPAAC
jgi:hypothetical protein